MTTPSTAESGAQMAQRFRDAALRFSRPRDVHADMLVRFGGAPLLVRIRNGQVASAEVPSAPLPSCHFALTASVAAWTRFWQPVPEAGWHDLFALSKRCEMSIEGDLRPLMANLQFIKDLLATGREAGA
ncbi:hypothetical protein [Achromobacter pestifer]